MTEQDRAKLPEDVLIIVPMRETVVFPHAVMPVALSRERSIAAVQEAVRTERQVGFLLQRDPAVEVPGHEELHGVGTAAAIIRYVTSPDGTHHLIARGERRFRIVDYLDGFPFLVARVEYLTDREDDSPETAARVLYLKQRARETLELMAREAAELAGVLEAIESPGQLADTIAAFMDTDARTKQNILEAVNVRTRLNLVIEVLTERLDILRLTKEIDEQTKSKFDAQARERMLRERMETIRQELGEDGDQGADIEALEKSIEEAGMPDAVAEEARRELKRLSRMGEQAAEHGMLRTWLEWIVALPWSRLDDEVIDIERARRVLDEDHHGLDRVKKRILEFLAVRKLNPTGKSPILCLVGPPGVGKTSLGKSIARALGVEFVRASLGGVHDEAEIRGHRRTYIGALPGNIVRALRKAGTRNPVFMLDEIDKLGQGIHGDPSSALLEVLDPEQNDTFTDNYLGVPFDLSRVLFVATANVLDAIAPPLRDRMEVIEIPGYTAEEKLEIARRYLVPRQLEENGLDGVQVQVADEALARIIASYTREAGVRSLERQIGAVLRHAAVEVASGVSDEVTIGAEELAEILGPVVHEPETAMRVGVPGVATGLAWTPVGGDILFVEATRSAGKGRLILTGQLGDVMRESAQAALSLVKSRAAGLGIDQAFDESEIHIHVPAGAIQKDGPSAGVALFVALVSLLTGRTVRHDVAMTGEISLRGLVLPVGGIKEKCLAALRAGIRTVCLPARNRKDLEEIPEAARRDLRFVWLDTVDDALAEVFEPADRPAREALG